ncbi:MAG: glycosyltransferase [Eubacteriales bacterium]
MKKIYICHQYDTKSHFEALYCEGVSFGYEVSEYFVLTGALRRLARGIIKERKVIKSVLNYINEMKKIMVFMCLRNEVLVVGLAPYDYTMNIYKYIFNRNYSIYFTSYTDWDEKNMGFSRGRIENKVKFERILQENFVGAACVSEVSTQQIRKRMKIVGAVGHAIRTDEYSKKGNTDRKNRVIYLGQLKERKNIDILLEWFSRNNSQGLVIDFVGMGNLQHKVEVYSQKYQTINYLGSMSKKDIKKKLKNYDFLILPSIEEPFGIVLLEALASGVPCIASNTVGPSEIIVDGFNGFLFDLEGGREEKNFVNTMKRVLNVSDDEYIKMVLNSLESGKKYDVKEVIMKWDNLITKAIEEVD